MLTLLADRINFGINLDFVENLLIHRLLLSYFQIAEMHSSMILKTQLLNSSIRFSL